MHTLRNSRQNLFLFSRNLQIDSLTYHQPLTLILSLSKLRPSPSHESKTIQLNPPRSGLLGIIDVLEFGANDPERGPGVDIVLGFTNLSDIPTSQFNWVQEAVGDIPPTGKLANLLFSDCTSDYGSDNCPYYYGPNDQNILHSSGYFSPQENSYDLLFQNQPDIQGQNHYANFITSLTIMGTGGYYTNVFSIEWGYMINGSQWQTTFPQQGMPQGLLYFGPGMYW
jgi:hypothetical protein